MSDPYDHHAPVQDEEREAWKALVAKLRADREKAEKAHQDILAELQRRDVTDFHIAQMVKLGLETDNVIYMQCVLNAYKHYRCSKCGHGRDG